MIRCELDDLSNFAIVSSLDNGRDQDHADLELLAILYDFPVRCNLGIGLFRHAIEVKV